MRLSLVVVVLAVAGALALSTAAAPFTDPTPEIEEVTLAPAEGPNGIYAVETGGELAIQITDDRERLAADGVSEGSVTTIEEIFEISYDGAEPARVWIETETDDVRFRDSDRGEPLEGESNSVTLGSGGSVLVGLTIDATGDHDVEEIESFTVAAALPEDTEPPETPGVTPGPPGDDPGETDPTEPDDPDDPSDPGDPDDSTGDTGPDDPSDPGDGPDDGPDDGDDDRTGATEGTEPGDGEGTDDSTEGTGPIAGPGSGTSGLIDAGEGPGFIEPEQSLGGFLSRVLLLVIAILAGAGVFSGLRRALGRPPGEADG